MISVTVELPNAVHESLARMAADQGTTVERMIADAVGSDADLARWKAEHSKLENRALRAEPGAMAEILARVPDVAPEPYDRFEDAQPFDRGAFDRQIEEAAQKTAKR